MRIEVRSPAEVAEVSLALQAANQQRLADRQADGWAERDASRLAERAQSLVDNPASRQAANDPWRGAVPEFEPVPEVRARLFGKRFEVAGAYWRHAQDGRLHIWTASREHSIEINLPGGVLWYEVLPAGGDRLILLIYSYTMDVQYTPHEIITDTGWFKGAPSLNSTTGIKHEDVSRTRIITRESWTTASASYAEYKNAFMVRKNEVKHLGSWPSTLDEILRRKYKMAKALQKITTPAGISSQRNEFTQFVISGSSYIGTGLLVPDSVFAPGTGETVSIMPPGYGVYAGGLWVPVGGDYEYNGHPAFDPTTMSVRPNPFGSSGEVYYVMRTLEEITYLPSSNSNEDYVMTFTPNAYQSPTLLEFGSPGGPDVAGIYVWYPLLRSYGYGYLVNRDGDGQTPGWGTTPAVFSFLKNYSGEFHKEDGDTQMISKALSYQYAREKYLPQDAPTYFLTADVTIPDADEGAVNNYYYFKAPPPDAVIDYGDPLSFRTDGIGRSVALSLNRGEYTKEVVRQSFSESQRSIECSFGGLAVGEEIPVAAWDWDRPLACWIELSRLGFTPEDLMLSESEAQALAAANWEEAGFKF